MTGPSCPPHLPLALILGCGGIGMACARRLGQSHRLILVDLDGAKAVACAATLSAEGHVATGLACDVADAPAVATLATTVVTHGKLRTLVHVVGLAPSHGDWRAILCVNATGAARIAEAFLPALDDPAAAVFISSLGGHIVPRPARLAAGARRPAHRGFSRPGSGRRR